MVKDSIPSLIKLDEYNGNWTEYVEIIYNYYLNEVVNSNLKYKGLPIRCKYFPPTNDKGYGFWHAISEGKLEDDRIPDLRRCERIRWIPWIIRQAKDGISNEVTWWENIRGHNKHIILFFEKESYVVILAKRKSYYLFKTAYCANEKRKKQLIKERNKFWNAKKAKGVV